ncbi:31785_t:CDS:2, partial [Racocetra persica]
KKTTASHIKSKSIDNDDQDSEDTLSVLKKLKTSSNQSQSTINSYFTHPLSKNNIDIIHEALVKFFITCDSEEIYNIDDWDDNINDTLISIELKDKLEIFFEEEQAELEDITNLTPKFIIKQLVDINDPIFYNQTVLNNFIDK